VNWHARASEEPSPVARETAASSVLRSDGMASIATTGLKVMSDGES